MKKLVIIIFVFTGVLMSAQTIDTVIHQSSFAKITKSRFNTGYKASSSYDRDRKFHLIALNNKAAVVWQDVNTQDIILTKFEKNNTTQVSIKLNNVKKGKLQAVCANQKGDIFYVVTQGSSGKTILLINKTDSEGKLLKSFQPSTEKKEMNIWDMDVFNDMAYANGKILLMLTRTYYKSTDGLNHQGGGAWLFDENTLQIIESYGQTSGHSFDNFISVDNKNNFVAVDLGDNYPRGVHLHTFSETEHKDAVVYSFKTEHGLRSSYSDGMPKYPLYSEISTKGNKYYKWSNDNSTYSELGGVLEVADGYLVFFTGEPSPTGKSLDNSRVNTNDSRNVGFVKVKKDFSSSSKIADIILSEGPLETGGFFTFTGVWTKLENKGVNWITSYNDQTKLSASHLKTAKINDNLIALLWSAETTGGEITTYAAKIDGKGKLIGKIVTLGAEMQLDRRDDLLVIDSKVYYVSSNSNNKVLQLFKIDFSLK